MNRALITGITGQDGSYLAELLLQKGYQVCGLVRRASTFNTHRIDHLIEQYDGSRFTWRRGDLTDGDSLIRTLSQFSPNEIYHLGAQSHVGVSFEIPNYTLDTVANGTLRLLEAIKTLGLDCKIYNACSSEMFGSEPSPQSEITPFRPQSTYAIGKVAGHNLARLYREAFDMKVYNGILFNHESPRRGETFVTRKITRAVARMVFGLEPKLYLGNLDAKRDWGYAPEYVEAMWMMLNTSEPDDYVIATAEQHTVREFVDKAFEFIGIELHWHGEGVNETAKIAHIDNAKLSNCKFLLEGQEVVAVNPQFFRPAEVNDLCGDYRKAKEHFGWSPKVTFAELVGVMMQADLDNTKLQLHGSKQIDESWQKFVV